MILVLLKCCFGVHVSLHYTFPNSKSKFFFLLRFDVNFYLCKKKTKNKKKSITLCPQWTYNVQSETERDKHVLLHGRTIYYQEQDYQTGKKKNSSLISQTCLSSVVFAAKLPAQREWLINGDSSSSSCASAYTCPFLYFCPYCAKM